MFWISDPVTLSRIVSCGNLAATGLSILAITGTEPTPKGVVSPALGAANNIAEVLKWLPDVNLISPLTIPTETFSPKIAELVVLYWVSKTVLIF